MMERVPSLLPTQTSRSSGDTAKPSAPWPTGTRVWRQLTDGRSGGGAWTGGRRSKRLIVPEPALDGDDFRSVAGDPDEMSHVPDRCPRTEVIFLVTGSSVAIALEPSTVIQDLPVVQRDSVCAAERGKVDGRQRLLRDEIDYGECVQGGIGVVGDEGVRLSGRRRLRAGRPRWECGR